ncbi:MAG: hypothetical protein ACRDJO_02210 [Actinomycetota bacterium]
MKKAIATFAVGTMLSVMAPTAALADPPWRDNDHRQEGRRMGRCDDGFHALPTRVAGFLARIDNNHNGQVCFKFTGDGLRIKDDKIRTWRGNKWH